MDTNVSEEHLASIFRVEGKAAREEMEGNMRKGG
jgi:hypothetical protein